MRSRRFSLCLSIIAAGCLVPGLAVGTADAQNGRPQPDAAPRPTIRPATPATQAPPERVARPNGAGETRRDPGEGSIHFTLHDASIEQIMEHIVKATGKVVIPIKLSMLKTSKITLMSDEPVSATRALDLIFEAFRLNDIGVIETHDKILIGNINEISSIAHKVVIGPSESVMTRSDLGNFVVKFFRLKEAEAENVADQIEDYVPEYAKMSSDAMSNQIMVEGDIALCQHLQLLIDELDRVDIPVATKTYRLQYADASEIAENILELYEDEGSSQARPTRQPRGRQRPGQANRQNQNAATPGQPGPTVELRLTVNTQQNTVTITADPTVVKNIDVLIDEYWDLPRPEETSKSYRLRYTDPIKMRDMLQELLESGGSGGTAGARRASTRGGGAGGQRAGVEASVSGIYRIEAYPDLNSLVVLCKTKESFGFLDGIIDTLDQPSTVGLPIIVELKHAEAVSLADELNILLSEAGSNITMDRPGRGLSAQGITGGDDAGGGGGGGGAAGGREAQEGGEMRFPWMSGGRQRDDQAPESSLVGKIRVVPILRQNALAILAPPQYQEKVREIVYFLDQPGRQVMISAIIAEVELTDDLALGLRVSATDIPLTQIDNSISGNFNATAQADNFLDEFFSTGVLDFGASVNVVLQALQQKTNVRVLQEPRVFTADNQEAVFFDGQDIPFVTDSFTNNTGGLTQGFEYRQVGVVLNARPRITAEKDVDMEIYLELSSIVPGQTLFGGFIVDRRSTTTQVVVKDGQTIVVSGILRDTESEIKRKIPVLGDLPFIGPLFSSIDSNKVTTELVAFITPIVVDNPGENDENFNKRERQKLDAVRQPLSELNIDEAREEIRKRIVDPHSHIIVPEDGSMMMRPEEDDDEGVDALPVGADLISDRR